MVNASGHPAEAATWCGTPTLRVLGPVRLDAYGPAPDPSHQARLTELAALLALVPASTAASIDEAIWPDRRADTIQNTRNTAVSRLRRWLAGDADGPYLARGSLQLRLATDWHAFLDLSGHAPDTMLSRSTAQLTAALRLVSGQPFAGVHPSRYRWADRLQVEMTIRIAAVATELAGRYSAAPVQAAWAAGVGLQVMPGDEQLASIRDSALALA
jgi:hypothetical protein